MYVASKRERRSSRFTVKNMSHPGRGRDGNPASMEYARILKEAEYAALSRPSFASGQNLTFGTLAKPSKPAETLACSRYHLLRSDH
jgi:hypothetical protein